MFSEGLGVWGVPLGIMEEATPGAETRQPCLLYLFQISGSHHGWTPFSSILPFFSPIESGWIF